MHVQSTINRLKIMAPLKIDSPCFKLSFSFEYANELRALFTFSHIITFLYHRHAEKNARFFLLRSIIVATKEYNNKA